MARIGTYAPIRVTPPHIEPAAARRGQEFVSYNEPPTVGTHWRGHAFELMGTVRANARALTGSNITRWFRRREHDPHSPIVRAGPTVERGVKYVGVVPAKAG